MEVIDCDPELGTRRLSAADALPLSVYPHPNFVSGRNGSETRLGKLFHHGNRSGKMRIECHQRRIGKHDLCRSKVVLSRDYLRNRN